MKRRDVLKASMAAALLHGAPAAALAARQASRVRPGMPGWPDAQAWRRLGVQTGGRLIEPVSPFAHCGADGCAAALKGIQSQYYIGDHPALTQSSGWQDAWVSQVSPYAVAARTAQDVAAAVRFARRHGLRLVVKGGGHSYLGTSNAPDSLLVWTRAMNDIAMHDAFVGHGCAPETAGPAVSIGAGALWAEAYAAVTTRGGRYVQGGGCTTVGVAGLVQGGGFGNFSRRYGTAAANLVEAEVVTADGEIRIANAATNPDLFWALKGGGSSFGIMTRLTLRTHALPAFFGGVFGKIEATTDEDFRALVARFVAFHAASLCDEHWGETVSLRGGGRRMQLSMVFQGLDEARARAIWAPFLDWVRARKAYRFEEPLIVQIPARHFWDPAYHATHLPGAMTVEDGPRGAGERFVWTGDREQAGGFLHGYRSAWLPAALQDAASQDRLVDALCGAAAQWDVELHFNKALGDAAQDARDATRDTAMNPAVLDAFVLAIIAGAGGPAFPGMPGAGPDERRARQRATAIHAAMDTLLEVAPGAGAYLSESDYFQRDWQQAYWGGNYARLARVKRAVDPDGLFFVHHGVGSEAWSADGFTRRPA
ncbi:FAD-binding oxidoreductase [uncultured Massilia sp.]|uniref:FAD-binding oxidoreductase n=1 Tax=uncultured Massilia sp. TaxID=169973 RepID=UPI0025FC42A3|nr:FAD-binding oxidoreductase [uncultured Massilia sp.]